MTRLVTMTIFGELASKANSRRVTSYGKIIKSHKALTWSHQAALQIPAEYRGLRLGSIQEPLYLNAKIYYKDWRSDVDESLLMDVLQSAGVIANDRYIRLKNIDGTAVDKDSPRVELVLGFVEDL